MERLNWKKARILSKYFQSVEKWMSVDARKGHETQIS